MRSSLHNSDSGPAAPNMGLSTPIQATSSVAAACLAATADPSVPSPSSAAPDWQAPPPVRQRRDPLKFDEAFTRRVVRYLDPLLRAYFRAELRGAENFPDQQSILVANHDGGMLPLDGLIIGSGWHRRHDFKKPMHVLCHDIVLRFAPWLRRAGAILADRHNLDAAMDAGQSVLVYPGASRETFRTFWERKKITLGNRTGFIKHALSRGVPLTPVVSAGVHETFLVLWRGTWLANRLGFARLFRADVFPIVAGLPFGIWLGACLPQLPLPAKITVQVLPPIDVRAEAARFLGRPLTPADFENPTVIEFCFHRVRDTMQRALDALYAERRFPVIG